MVSDDDKNSFVEAQKALDFDIHLAGCERDGVEDIRRIVCGGCLDFKDVANSKVETFGAWEEWDLPLRECLSRETQCHP